ncbi:MAG TPA: von Willebrand factor type A domain-containing protein [Chitinophagaceae bacterium]|nr:von Willebrand factor type A domain-containing protein [Chitinophagaceae bacterium]
MKFIFTCILWLFFYSIPLSAQYYLRGEIKDEKGKFLPNVKISLFSKNNFRFSYTSGNSGSFGIPSTLEIDTILLTLPGYEVLKKAVNTRQYQSITMNMLASTASLMKNNLRSKTKKLLAEQYSFFSTNGESYSNLVENDFIKTSIYPETGFGLNIDRASYSNIRRFLNNGVTVPVNAVRIEEMLNYFDYNLNRDKNSTKVNEFCVKNYLSTCPWDNNSSLLFLTINAPKLNLDTIPPCNLVFLIDVSGSMDKPNRLPLLQSAFKMLVDNLRDIDLVTIVIYGGGVAKVLDATSGSEKVAIKNVIDSLSASGDTPGQAAIQTAYASVAKTFIPGGNNRVILATDGDFNVGVNSEKALEDLITGYMQSGIYLTCLGVGMGNYKDSKLETLAKKGRGNFAYIDNLAEAQKVLVSEFTKTLYSVANDASINIEFNSKNISEYRLIGFDNKKSAIIDNNSELEGGEVGSGHNMIAIFELKDLPNSKEKINIGEATLQFKTTDSSKKLIIQNFNLANNIQAFDTISNTLKFATAVSMFGSLLKQSKYANGYDFETIYRIALPTVLPNEYAKQEFLRLLFTAEKIYNPKRKRHNKKQEGFR